MSQSMPEKITEAARWQDRFAEVNGVRLHYVEAGAGPLLVLLHGFPEFWYGWRRQIPALAAAGFRVIAPDLRGYNLSEKPRGVAAYGVRHVVDDVAGLIAALGVESAHVVGHDWGAGIAWAFAMRHPAALRRLAILNGPHPTRMLSGLANPRQLAKSWYMFFFQLPKLPEYVLGRHGYAMLLEAFERLPASARFTHEELAAYRQAFERPGALEAMLNYYRGMFRASGAVRLARIEAEVLVLWGTADPYLGRELAEPSAKWMPRGRVEYFPGVGHFIQHEQPEAVNERLIRFFSADPSA